MTSVVLLDFIVGRGEGRGYVADNHVHKATGVAKEARHDNSQQWFWIHVYFTMLQRDTQSLQCHHEFIRIFTDNLVRMGNKGNRERGRGRGKPSNGDACFVKDNSPESKFYRQGPG